VLQCPTCATRLAPVISHSFRSWHCPTCHGNAATVEAVGRVASRRATQRLWITVNHVTPRASRYPCPACRSTVRVASLQDGEHTLELDACRPCRLLWFEPGELPALNEFPPGEDVVEPGVRDLPMAARAVMAAALAGQVRERAYPEAAFDQQAQPESRLQEVASLLGLPFEVAGHQTGGIPWFTWGLGALVLVVGVVVLLLGKADGAATAWGFVPAAWGRHAGLTLVTSFFLHADGWHLLTNLYFLAVFGDDVEEALGRWRLAALLVVATVAGHLVQGLLGG